MCGGMDNNLRNFGADERRQVNDFLSGQGRAGFFIILGILGLAFVWFLVAGLVS